MKFKDRVTLVVGGACGMGAATVLQLVQEGAKIIIFDIRDDAAEELIEEINEDYPDAPGTIETFIGDVTDKTAREGILKLISEKYGHIDNLLYIAGVLDLMCPAHKTDDELWEYVMDANCTCAFKLIRDALPMLLDHDDLTANIVIVGSVGGVYGSSAGAAYIASKHAALGLMRNLAWSYKDHNIRINAVNPGAISSDILENAMIKWPDRPIMDPDGNELYNVRGLVSLNVDADGNSVLGDTEDIAEAICFLISDEAKFICGTELTVDGGWASF